MSFDLRHLRYVVAAAEHRSFFQAALALEVEQSTMSRNILRLERRLGVTLFRRSHAGVSLTSAGLAFIESGREILAKADDLAATMQVAGDGQSSRLTFGYDPLVPTETLRAALLGWREDHPDIALDRIAGRSETLLAALDTGIIDLAILAGDTAYPRTARTPLSTERLMAVLPTNHRLSPKDHVGPEDLHDEMLLLSADCSNLPGIIRQAGIASTIRVLHESPQAILALLEADHAIALSCAGAVSSPHVAVRPVHDAQGCPVVVLFSGYWRTQAQNPLVRKFMALVRGVR